VIQRQDHNSRFLSTVFWANVIFGLIAMTMVIAVSPLAASFWREERLIPVLAVLSVSFPLNGLVALQRALLEKALDFEVLAKVEMLSTAIAGGFAIAVALAGGGVWALVLQTVTSVAAMAVFLWVKSEWRPRFEASLTDIRSIAGFSGYLTGFNVVNYFARNADYLLIGWLLA
jgi:PST family polysaccharide transporter